MPPDRPDAVKPALVACLCAEWCGVCRDYTQTFRDMEARFPQARFLWIDVEDEADLLHPLDVDDFPTILVARGAQPLFFGPITPQLATLERLVQNHISSGVGTPPKDPALAELLLRVRAAHPAEQGGRDAPLVT